MQEKCERKKRCGQESFAFDRKQISENYLGIYTVLDVALQKVTCY